MLEERLDRWMEQMKQDLATQVREQVRAEFLAKGPSEWMLEVQSQGQQDAQRRTLKRQLARRFGPLPASAEARIAQASLEQLERWLDAVLDADSVDEVLQA